MRPARLAALCVFASSSALALPEQVTTPSSSSTADKPADKPASASSGSDATVSGSAAAGSSTATSGAPASGSSSSSGGSSSTSGPAPVAGTPPTVTHEETFTPIAMPPGEAPPLPFPVVLSVGSVLNPRLSVGDFYLDPHVRVRLRGAWVQQDPNLYFVGRNSGFNLAMARVGVTGGFRKSVKFALSLEGAADVRQGSNQLVGELSTRLRDAFFTFAPWDFIQLTAGHFRPPSDRESLASLDAAAGAGRAGTPQLLPEPSVGTRGVFAGEGLQVRGMDPGRDLGVMVHGDIYPLQFVGGTYAFAVVNGNGQTQVLNDNNLPTAYGRITFGVRNLPVLSLLDVGVSAHYGRNTNQSALPNTFNDEVMGAAVDGAVQILGFQVLSQVHWVQTRHLTTAAPTELTLGSFVQVAWRDILGFSPVARVAYYQASSGLPQFTVAEFTGGMRYDVPGLPITAHLAFTHPEETGWGIYDLGEANATRETRVPSAARVPAAVRRPLGVNNWMVDRQDGLSITNDRLEAVLQMSF